MNIIKLAAEETRESGFTHKAVIGHADLTVSATATAQVIELVPVVLGSLVTKVATRVVTAFSDASDTDFNDVAITIGDGGSANRFLASQQVNVNGTEVLAKAGTGTLHAYTGADTVDVTFNSMTGKSLSELDGGEIVIFLSVFDSNTLV